MVWLGWLACWLVLVELTRAAVAAWALVGLPG